MIASSTIHFRPNVKNRNLKIVFVFQFNRHPLQHAGQTQDRLFIDFRNQTNLDSPRHQTNLDSPDIKEEVGGNDSDEDATSEASKIGNSNSDDDKSDLEMLKALAQTMDPVSCFKNI